MSRLVSRCAEKATPLRACQQGEGSSGVTSHSLQPNNRALSPPAPAALQILHNTSPTIVCPQKGPHRHAWLGTERNNTTAEAAVGRVLHTESIDGGDPRSPNTITQVTVCGENAELEDTSRAHLLPYDDTPKITTEICEDPVQVVPGSLHILPLM